MRAVVLFSAYWQVNVPERVEQATRTDRKEKRCDSKKGTGEHKIDIGLLVVWKQCFCRGSSGTTLLVDLPGFALENL